MWWRRLLARYLGGEVVWLETLDGTMYLRWASPSGIHYIAHISRTLGAGTVLLDLDLKPMNSNNVVKNVYRA
jgi:hypothetical protein